MKRALRADRIALTVALAVLAGCQPEETDALNVAQVEAPAAETAAPPASAPALTDAQVAHIAVTANAIDVDIARLAEERASAPEVKAFAATMIADHTSVNERAGALAQRLGVVPEENPVSRSLQSDAAGVTARLSGLSGAEFDRAYVEREVAYHEQVLGALDEALIPSASNAELKALLEEVRPVIAHHLDQARSLGPRVTAP